MHDSHASSPLGLHAIHSLGFDLLYVSLLGINQTPLYSPNCHACKLGQGFQSLGYCVNKTGFHRLFIRLYIRWLPGKVQQKTGFHRLFIRLYIGWLPGKVQHSKVKKEIELP
jgi:hypothetical protein